MGLFDAALEMISPRAAFQRAEWRQAREMQKRYYDAAGAGRRTENWRRVSTSQNAEASSALGMLRNGARELCRNNPYAAAAKRALRNHIAGKGIMPRPMGPMAESERTRRRAVYWWDKFAEECDPEGRQTIYGQQRLVAATVPESGEALILTIPVIEAGQLRLYRRVLEPDHLDDTRNEATRDGNVIIQGVEFDPIGRRVAYWLWPQHPGETVAWPGNGQSVRVAAQWVDHVFETVRAGQARGVTWFAPSALSMRDLGDYDDAVGVKKKIEACFVGFVRNQNVAPGPQSITGDARTEDGRRGETMRPGMIKFLQPGEDVQFGQPSATGGEADYQVYRLHAISAGIGTTYVQLTGDATRANFSSQRANRLVFDAALDGWQQDMMIPQDVQRAWRRCMMVASTIDPDVPAALPAFCNVPRRPYVNPPDDVKADLDAARAGLETMEDLVAARGGDPDEHVEEIAKWNARLDAHGVVLDTDPRKTSRQGSAHKEPPDGRVAA